MEKETLHKIINRSKRVFNSIKPNQITEVDTENLDLYLGYGFKHVQDTVVEDKTQEDTVAEDTPELSVKELKAKITELGGEFTKKDLKPALQEILAKLQAGDEDDNEGTKSEDELKKLLNDAGIDFEDGDDLQKLVDENNLV